MTKPESRGSGLWALGSGLWVKVRGDGCREALGRWGAPGPAGHQRLAGARVEPRLGLVQPCSPASDETQTAVRGGPGKRSVCSPQQLDWRPRLHTGGFLDEARLRGSH